MTIPVWVKLFYLPMELWSPEGLSRVASTIGKPLQVDRMTTTKCGISYAMVCIDMSAENEPVDELTVQFNNAQTGNRESVNVKFQYQWTPIRSAKCKSFGHNCEKKTQAPNHKPVMMKKGPSNDVWMVRRKGKKVEETYEPFPSQQPTLIDTNCASKCNVQVDAQNMEPNQLLEFVKEQSHDNCGSAGLALAEDQTNKSVIHKQVKSSILPLIESRSREQLKNTS